MPRPPTKPSRSVRYRASMHEETRARRDRTRLKLNELTARCRDCGAVADGHQLIVHVPGCDRDIRR